MKKLGFLTVVAGLVLGACGPSANAASGFDAAALKAIPTRMQSFVSNEVVSGAVTLVARRD